MALLFVSSTGSNTSPYETWAKAATSLQTALTAMAAGDTVVLDYADPPAADKEVSADVTWTFNASGILVASDRSGGGSTITPTEMGTTDWIGNSTTNRSITLAGADTQVLIWGVTFRTAGSTLDHMDMNPSAGSQRTFENCYFWNGNTNTGGRIKLSGGTTNGNYSKYKDCTFRFGSTSQGFEAGVGTVDIIGGSVTSAGSIPGTLFRQPLTQIPTAVINCLGVDWSEISGTLVGDSSQRLIVTMDRCKLNASVTPLATQSTNPTAGSPEITLIDCNSGDTHGTFAYYNACGQMTLDTGIYFTTGAAAASWKIETTANASFSGPFVTPWFSFYNTATSAITPYIEILRGGSSTAYDDDEAWAEFAAKTTSASPLASLYSGRMALGGTPAANASGAGLGSWTGESVPSWSGKLTLGSSLTPAENGDLSARIFFGVPSAVLFIDPFIRT
jgi:hypothetical protein